MYDDEYDDELPPISVNSLATKNNQFIMPPADVIASQRAHEEECEQELRDLRSQYETEVVTAISHDSSGSEGETLAAAIESMKVHSSQTASQLNAVDLMQKIIDHLPDSDTIFLKNYLDVLQKEDVATIRTVSENVMSSIEDAIRQGIINGNMLNEQELLVLCLWLCSACLWVSPQLANARRALHILITYFTQQQMELFCRTLGACLESAALVRASDALWSGLSPSAASQAAASLLRLALEKLAPHEYQMEEELEPVGVASLTALGGAWRSLSAPQQYVALQIVGRVLAGTGTAGTGIDEPAVSRLLSQLATPPPQYRFRPDYLKVLMAVSKLQNLFKNYQSS